METKVRERSLTDLVEEIMGDVQRLIRQEVRLARVELTESLRQLALGVVGLVVAAALAYLGIWFAGLAVFFAIFLAVPGWAAGLAVAAGFLILAAFAFALGYQRLRLTQLKPGETIESLEEDREWLERRVR
jgi:uncharacterized membrane protein YqjE